MKRKSKAQAMVEYVLIIALLLVGLSGVYAVLSKTLHSHWAVYSKVISGPLP